MTSDTALRVLVSALLLVAGCGSADSTEPQPSSPGSTNGVEAISFEGPGLAISVSRVSDGDSLRATSAEGDLEIRLLGINAPEGDECFGDEAKSELTGLLEAEPVVLHPWPADRDEFGRTLGFLSAGGVFVNLALLETGHAVARDQSDHGFAAEFESAEARAAEAGLGLWAPTACGPASGASLEIVDLLADAPGDDRQNPNGEYVVIENTGDDVVNLEGWALRDESTRHRYSFPALELAPGRRVLLRSGCGEDDRNGDPIELFWCDPEPPIWNNGGDTAFLLDPGGNTADFLRS